MARKSSGARPLSKAKAPTFKKGSARKIGPGEFRERMVEPLREASAKLLAYKAVPENDRELLDELVRRGGTLRAVAEAQLLLLKKSEDYNRGTGEQGVRDSYFPFGAASYAQMIHTKAQRFTSLTKKEMADEDPNFEGLRDTALDLINYASFVVERMNREGHL